MEEDSPLTSIPPRGQAQLKSADHLKRWTPDDQQILDEAVRTGLLPDGRVATQNRAARYLRFNRNTIITHLNGRVFPRCYEAEQDGGRMSGYVRALKRAFTTIGQVTSGTQGA